MNYKFFGLWAVLALFAGLIFVLYRWPRGKQYTFSQHVAVHRWATVYYSLLFLITLPLLLLFFIRWFAPVLQLSGWFTLSIVISSIMQFACTLVPETGGRRTTIHQALAGVSAVFLLPCLAILLASNAVNLASKILTILSLLTMLSIVLAVRQTKNKPGPFLLLQSAYFAAFFIPILYISYLQ
jgi:hypothetical protein